MLVFESVPVLEALSMEVSLALADQVVGAQALAYALWFTVIRRLPAGIASIVR